MITENEDIIDEPENSSEEKSNPLWWENEEIEFDDICELGGEG